MLTPGTTPGPLGAGGYGNRLAFERDRLGFLLHQRQYGDLVRFDQGMYLVNSPDLAEEVFKHTNTAYVITRDLLGDEVDGGSASADLARWMRARSLAGHGLNRSSVRAAEDRLAATVARHADSWRARGGIDAVPALEDLSAHLISEYCLGPEVGRVPELVARLQDARLPGTVPLPASCRFLRRRRLHRAGRELAREVSRLVERRRTRQDDCPGVLADLLLAACDEGAITHEGAVGIVMSVLFAAHETTAAALAWLFLLLDRQPEVYARMLAEVDGELAGRLPTAADLPRLVFTEAVVKETLRLYPPLWFLERTVDRPTELGGRLLHPGQQVFVSPFVLHRDPRHYDRPTEFRPDRWIDRPAGAPLPKYAFMPFGGGQRICLGAHFGTVAMVVATATVVGRHRLRLAVGSAPAFGTDSSVLQPRGLRLDVGAREQVPCSAAAGPRPLGR